MGNSAISPCLLTNPGMYKIIFDIVISGMDSVIVVRDIPVIIRRCKYVW